MKTTLNIPDERLEALLRVTRSKTRTEAVNTSIMDYIHRKNVDAVPARKNSTKSGHLNWPNRKVWSHQRNETCRHLCLDSVLQSRATLREND